MTSRYRPLKNEDNIVEDPDQNGGLPDSPEFVDSSYARRKSSNIELSRSFYIRQLSDSGTHSSLTFHNVNYSVKVKRGIKKAENKQILFNVNGLFNPGMNAIMGPTGSGKTTLLDLLAMRKDPSGFSGKILLEGQPLPKDFKLISCYVVQDDVVMGTLTVRENLMFSARLRLRGTQRLEIEDRVELVLDDLGLQSCADTMIGTELIKGVSGGERKRCNIGMELLTQPTILFLDEPTTGLDSTTALNVLNLLKKLSTQGRTVIFSIHQPRYSIFKLFDKLHLMSKGEVVYHGQAQKALEFFATAGFPCDSFNNPPDFFLDVMIECEAPEEAYDPEESSRRRSLVAQSDAGVRRRKDLAQAFKESPFYEKLLKRLEEAEGYLGNQASTELDLGHFKVDYPTSFFEQVFYLSLRLFKNVKRSPAPFIAQLFVAIMFSLVGGAFYWDAGGDRSLQSGFQNIYGASFFGVVNSMFAGIPVITIFITGRALFLHESSNGFYRVSSYFTSKVLLEALPLRTFPILAFGTIYYWMIGFKSDAGVFLYFLLTLWLVAIAGLCLGIFLSIFFSVIQVSILIVTMVFVISLMYGGLFVSVDSIPVPLNYLQYLSIVRFALSAVTVKELSGLNFTEGDVTKSGYDYLDDQGIKYQTDWDYGRNLFALGVIIIVSLLFAYIKLRTIKKQK